VEEGLEYDDDEVEEETETEVEQVNNKIPYYGGRRDPHYFDTSDPTTYLKNKDLSIRVHSLLDKMHLPPEERTILEKRLSTNSEMKKDFFDYVPAIIQQNLYNFNEFIIHLSYNDTAYKEHCENYEEDDLYHKKFNTLRHDLDEYRAIQEGDQDNIKLKLVLPLSDVFKSIAYNNTLREEFFKSLEDVDFENQYQKAIEQFLDYFTNRQILTYNLRKYFLLVQGNEAHEKAFDRRCELDPSFLVLMKDIEKDVHEFMDKTGIEDLDYENPDILSRHPYARKMKDLLTDNLNKDIVPLLLNDVFSAKDMCAAVNAPAKKNYPPLTENKETWTDAWQKRPPERTSNVVNDEPDYAEIDYQRIAENNFYFEPFMEFTNTVETPLDSSEKSGNEKVEGSSSSEESEKDSNPAQADNKAKGENEQFMDDLLESISSSDEDNEKDLSPKQADSKTKDENENFLVDLLDDITSDKKKGKDDENRDFMDGLLESISDDDENEKDLSPKQADSKIKDENENFLDDLLDDMLGYNKTKDENEIFIDDLLADFTSDSEPAPVKTTTKTTPSLSRPKGAIVGNPIDLRDYGDFYNTLYQINQAELFSFIFQNNRERNRFLTRGKSPSPTPSIELPDLMDKILELNELKGSLERVEMIIPEGFCLKGAINSDYLPVHDNLEAEIEDEEDYVQRRLQQEAMKKEFDGLSDADMDATYTPGSPVVLLQMEKKMHMVQYRDLPEDGKIYIAVAPYENLHTGEKDYTKQMLVVPRIISVQMVDDLSMYIDEGDTWKSYPGRDLPLGILRLPKNVEVKEIPHRLLKTNISNIIIPENMTVMRQPPGHFYKGLEGVILISLPQGSEYYGVPGTFPEDYCFISMREGLDGHKIFEITALSGPQNNSILVSYLLPEDAEKYPNGMIVVPPLTVVTSDPMDLVDNRWKAAYIETLPEDQRRDYAMEWGFRGLTDEDMEKYGKAAFENAIDPRTGKFVNEGKKYRPDPSFDDVTEEGIDDGNYIEKMDEEEEAIFKKPYDEEDYAGADHDNDVEPPGVDDNKYYSALDPEDGERKRITPREQEFLRKDFAARQGTNNRAKKNMELDEEKVDPEMEKLLQEYGDPRVPPWAYKIKWPHTPEELAKLDLPENTPGYCLIYQIKWNFQVHKECIPDEEHEKHKTYCRDFDHLIYHEVVKCPDYKDKDWEIRAFETKFHIFCGHPGQEDIVEAQIERFIQGDTLRKDGRGHVDRWILFDLQKNKENGKILITPDRFKGRGGFPEELEEGVSKEDEEEEERRNDYDIFGEENEEPKYFS
jgi:hypothetical protein